MHIAELTIQSSNTIAQSSFGLGSMLAVTFSWSRNRSIFWAALAGLFSWLYVLYFALSRRPDERRQ